MFWSYKPTRLLLLAAVATTGWSSACQAVLVAHYKFDETAGSATTANEVAANGGNGTVGANAVLGVAGIDGTAVQLPEGAGQDDIVDMGNASDIFSKITASGQLTISYWLKSTDTSGNRNVAVFLGNDTVQNSYIDSGIVGNTATPVGRAQGRNRGPNTANGAQIGELFSPADVLVNDDVFHHIALTIDTTEGINTGSLFVDGQLASAETNVARYSVFPDFSNLEVGRLGRLAPVDGFAGVIDDLQLYDNAISARDILRLSQNAGLTLEDIGPSLPGDTNDDGTVDVTDFNNIRDNLGYSDVAPGLGADIVGNDGVIDFRDLRFFQENFPSIVAAAGAQAVPEPTTVVLSLFAMSVVAGVARRRGVRSTTR